MPEPMPQASAWGEPTVLWPLDVPGVARCAFEPLDDRCDIESRRIANEHMDVVAGVAARQQLRADLAGLLIQHAGEPCVRGGCEQWIPSGGRPDDVHEQQILG